MAKNIEAKQFFTHGKNSYTSIILIKSKLKMLYVYELVLATSKNWRSKPCKVNFPKQKYIFWCMYKFSPM